MAIILGYFGHLIQSINRQINLILIVEFMSCKIEIRSYIRSKWKDPSFRIENRKLAKKDFNRNIKLQNLS